MLLHRSSEKRFGGSEPDCCASVVAGTLARRVTAARRGRTAGEVRGLRFEVRGFGAKVSATPEDGKNDESFAL
jgi:hypothetical protein